MLSGVQDADTEKRRLPAHAVHCLPVLLVLDMWEIAF
jgi:hypothetical protein